MAQAGAPLALAAPTHGTYMHKTSRNLKKIET